MNSIDTMELPGIYNNSRQIKAEKEKKSTIGIKAEIAGLVQG